MAVPGGRIPSVKYVKSSDFWAYWKMHERVIRKKWTMNKRDANIINYCNYLSFITPKWTVNKFTVLCKITKTPKVLHRHITDLNFVISFSSYIETYCYRSISEMQVGKIILLPTPWLTITQNIPHYCFQYILQATNRDFSLLTEEIKSIYCGYRDGLGVDSTSQLLQGTHIQFSTTTLWPTTVFNSSSWGSNDLLWLKASDIHEVYNKKL